MSKTGVLLINLGTPDNANVGSVRRYLKAFLSDERVLDVPWIVRQVLLYAWILPFRAKQTTKAYQAIWDKTQGSPLLFHSKALVNNLSQLLGENYHVELGMRYGNPSIAGALNKLTKAQCDKIIAIPLFPQYSSAASGSAIQALLKEYALQWNMPALTVIDKFYANDAYIKAYTQHVSSHLSLTNESHVLFSYHSLPVRQIHKSQQNCQKSCFDNAPCPSVQQSNEFCYRAQCYETSRQIAHNCQLETQQYSVVFQSRLGRTVWIGPDLQSTFESLISKGIKDLTILSPSFVADCLETLEELGMRAKESWLALGGKSFKLIPCLNASPLWVQALAGMIEIHPR